MSLEEIEKRLASLEKTVAELQEKTKAGNPWASVIGHFANDPVYDEIIRLGKEYRDSQHPDRKKKRKPRKS